MVQNLSHAVMSQRTEPSDSLDDFPTPPWATRALLAHVVPKSDLARDMTCLEPACGVGHMSKVLKEYFKEVHSSDVHDYGYGVTHNYLRSESSPCYDWVITNPPFRLAEQFFWRSLTIARVGIALLTRTVFIESVGRYERIFSYKPPTTVAQFVERVPMVKGRLDRTATTATSYSWMLWDLRAPGPAGTRLVWIPPCRKQLEMPYDYPEGMTCVDKTMHQGQGS